ncbi:MAG: hypothetical protein K0V04_15690 [Deltaproteobacteria bacterium]|nr:hypothetical protein [Deltaproteobacteria bacterium]
MDAVLDGEALSDCDQPPRLLDAMGAEVATSPRSFSFAYALVPDEPLVMGASYTIEHNCLGSRLLLVGDDGETSSFTVNTPADADPPALPDIAVGDTMAQEFENEFVGYSMDVEGQFEGILLVDIGQETTLDPEALEGEVGVVSVDTDFVIGHACVPTWADAQPGDSTTLAFASFDLAGNFSGWTEPEPVTVEDQGCQCRAGSSRPPVGTLALLLLGLWVRRRG